MKLDPLSQMYKDITDKLANLERKPMYHKIPRHNFAHMDNGAEVMPLVTLSDHSGGIVHIIKECGCFVLISKYLPSWQQFNPPGESGARYRKATHWFPEAVKALGEYLAPKPIYFGDHFCDAIGYAKHFAKPGANIQVAPESDADVARKTLRRIADDRVASPEVQVKAAATLLAHSDE